MGVGENYILVKAKDVKNDKRFYDIYTKVDFNYKFSAKEFPYYNYIWIDKNIIFCVDDYGLKILKLKSKLL